MQLSFISSIHQVSAEDWNRLGDTSDYPFLQHAFLSALEDSGSTGADTGWQPHHLLVRDRGQVRAAVPLYRKTHSYGEYVFDWAWADAYQRSGRRYYPKLVTAVPFTPTYGPRFMLANRTELDDLLPQLTEAITEEALSQGASSWHCLFPESTVSEQLAARGFSRRLGCQFHWFNQDYRDFDDFLQNFVSRKRKNLKKERRRVQEQGIELVVKTGDQVTQAEWDLFYQLYHLTYFKRSGRQGYLGPDFFHRLAESVPSAIVLVVAYRGGDMIAAALNFRDRDNLYGRYWGCKQEFDFLHFEACYYQGIEFAIRQGLKRFDPGAQGEHKIQRGFQPVATWSNHWIAEPLFKDAIDNFLQREQESVLAYMADAASYLPFKQSDHGQV